MLRSKVVERNLTVSNSTLKHNWTTSLLPLPDDSVLVGTDGAGLETMDRVGRFTPVELPSGTGPDLLINPNALFATSSHIYAGTLGNGCSLLLSTGRWSVVTTGLRSLAAAATSALAQRTASSAFPRRISHDNAASAAAVFCCAFRGGPTSVRSHRASASSIQTSVSSNLRQTVTYVWKTP